MQRLISCSLAAGLAIASASAMAGARGDTAFSPYVDAQGAIQLPKDFRSHWTHLGSYAVTQDGAPGQGFHDVYTQPESATAFKKTGQWPDGAVLVKEIRAVNQGTLTTGPAIWAGDNKVWFVMVKDAKGRFANNPNWGDGWGWALFDAKDRTKNASSDHRKDCMACHVPAQKTDWVYVDGYPTLNR